MGGGVIHLKFNPSPLVQWGKKWQGEGGRRADNVGVKQFLPCFLSPSDHHLPLCCMLPFACPPSPPPIYPTIALGRARTRVRAAAAASFLILDSKTRGSSPPPPMLNRGKKLISESSKMVTNHFLLYLAQEDIESGQNDESLHAYYQFPLSSDALNSLCRCSKYCASPLVGLVNSRVQT